jgi:hypothetical protein
MPVNAVESLPMICDRFNKNGVRYVVIGGCAINLHGFVRITRDIDFVVELSEENIECIKRAIKDLVPEIEGLTTEEVEKYGKHGVIRIGTRENFYIDITTKIGSLNYQKLKNNALRSTIEGVEIVYAGLDDMIALKSGYREVNHRDRLFLLGKREYLNKKDEKN